MKFTHVIYILIVASFLMACTPSVSDSDLQIAIEQAVASSVANVSPTETLVAGLIAEIAELENIQSQLDAANRVIAAQADQLAAMQDQIDSLQLAATPSVTPIPLPTATITPLPTPTKSSQLPEDQKLIYAARQTGLYTYTEKNDNGYPIMIKTDPIVRYYSGDWIIVLRAIVQGDGGFLFYEVVSPYGGGYFVDINHVDD